MARSLQLIGLPDEANEILFEKFVSEKGEEKLVPRYTRRLRGYTEPLFYGERAPLYEYVDDKPPNEFDEDGFSIGEEFLIRVVYYEQLQGAPWSSGPMAHMKLVENSTNTIVAKWPVSGHGCIVSDY